MTELFINEVHPQSSTNTMLVTFQNGYTNSHFKSSNCKLFMDNTTKRKTAVASLDDLLYAGEENIDSLLKTVLLVRDKTTGKVRLIETTTADMKPMLQIKTKVLQDTSLLELSRKFGSKKQKKQMEQKEKLKVKTEIVNEQMLNITENISEEKLDMSLYTKTETEEMYIPPELFINEVHPQSSTNTMLVTFQNGYTNSHFKSSNCKLFMDNTTKRKTAVASLDDLLYAGEENIDSLLKTVLLVRDKTTGKVRLIETTTADMKPMLQIKTKVLQDTSLLELSRKFGSKKQKKQMEQKEKLKVKTEIVNEQMLNITENISEEKLDMSLYTKTETEEMYIPPELFINEVHPQSSTNTMLVTFQNGYTNSHFKSSNCKLFMDNTTKRKTAVASLDDLLYAGEENIDSLLKTVLLVRDKTTGKVRLIETTTADMKPMLQIKTKVLQDTSLLELSRKFGSKKQKKQMEQKEKLKVKTEIVNEQMLNITENISEEKLDMSLYTKTETEEMYIPPELFINEVHPQSSTNTMLVTFQNGYTNSHFKSSNCKLFMDNTTKRKTAVASLDDLLYAGEENIDSLLKTVLLVRDKTTGKVRLIETTTADMKPMLQIKTKVLQDTSLLELSRKFGSKKQKKQMEQKEKLKVKTEIVNEQMLNITENISEEKLDMSLYTKTETEEMYIPPINRAADKVEDVYEISKILTEEQFDKIQLEISEKDFKSEIHTNILPLISKTTSQHHIILSLYASALIKMYSTLFKELSKKTFMVCKSSSTLNEIILTNFTMTVGGKRTHPNTMKDKALCHALVFILIINNFKFKLDEFAAMSKLTVATATLKARAVGAHVTLSGDKKTIQLKLPLNNTSGFKRRRSAKF